MDSTKRSLMSIHIPLRSAGRRGLFSTAALRAFSMCALMLLGASCRTVEPARVPFSATAVRLDLTFVRQEARFDCGLASISALCRYWEIAIPSAEREALAERAAEQGGLSGAELQKTLEQLGLEVYLFQGSLDRTATGLYAHIDSKRPPLIMSSGDSTEPHYEILIGYDEPLGSLILLDPVRGELLVPVTEFERDWSRCKRFTLLASRRPGVPTAHADGALSAVARH